MNFYVVIGFRTEHRTTDPVALFMGADRAAMQDAVDAAPADILRIETGAFEFLGLGRRTAGSKPGAVDGAGISDAPTREEVLEMVGEISRLGALLEAERQLAANELAGTAAQLESALREIQALKAQNSQPPTATASPEIPAASSPEEAAASSAGDDAGPKLDLGNESIAETDDLPTGDVRKARKKV